MNSKQFIFIFLSLVFISILSMGVMAVGTYPAVDPNMVLYYHFNNQSAYGENDTHVYDFSGNGNNGTIFGNANFTNNSVLDDNSIYFNGNTYVNVSKLLFGQQNISFSLWFKLDNNGTNTASSMPILTTNKIYSHSRYTNNIITTRYDSGGVQSSEYTIGSNTFDWHHLVVVYQDIQNITSIYIDGKLRDSDIHNSRVSSTANYVFQVGGFDSTNFTGWIDEVIIYNKTLNNLEVSSMYNNYFLCLDRKYTNNLFSSYILCSGNYSYNNSNFFNIYESNISLIGNNTNLIGNNSYYGIYTSNNLKNISISNISFIDLYYGIFFQGSNSSIFNNLFINNGFYDIRSRNGIFNNYSFNYFFRTNPINDDDSNIDLDNVSYSEISNNEILNGHYRAIYLYDGSGNNNIFNNFINNSYQNGIELSSGDNNRIYNNDVTYSNHNSIKIWTKNNSIFNNNFNYFVHHGVDLYDCITSAYVHSASSYNNVYLNNITNNIPNELRSNFIYICNSSNNNISSNNIGSFQTIFDNENNGIFLDIASDNNLIEFNNIFNMSYASLLFQGNLTYPNSNTTIKNNIFSGYFGDTIRFGSGFYHDGVFLNNIGIRDFYFNNITGDYNHTNSYDYFLNTNKTTTLYDLKITSALLTNGTSLCNGSNALTTGQVNITLNPNEYCYVLDNFNLTEGINRQYSPLNLTLKITTPSTIIYSINSSLTANLTVPFYTQAPCPLSISSNANESLNFTCNSKAEILSLNLVPGINTITLNYANLGGNTGGSGTYTQVNTTSNNTVTQITDTIIKTSKDLFKDPQSFILFVIAIIILGIVYLKWKKIL